MQPLIDGKCLSWKFSLINFNKVMVGHLWINIDYISKSFRALRLKSSFSCRITGI